MLEPQLACPEGLVYDDDAHSYLLDGEPVPSVSGLIRVIDPDQYAGIAEDVLQRAAERGNAGHKLIALDCREDLDFESLSELAQLHYIAWDQFRSDFGFDVEYSERCVASRKHRFAGTLDLAGRLRKHRKHKGQWLVDIKFTAALPILTGAQTAGYSLAAEECLPGWAADTPRGCLHIVRDTYRFHEYTSRIDRAAFLASRTILNYRSMKL